MRVIRPYEQSLFTLRALLVTATLLLVLGAFGTSASAQAGAAVSVDPSSGLVDEQVVEITGSGLTVDAHEAVVIRQCAAGAETAADCDFATTRYVGHNAGEWTLQAVVWREIDLLGGSRDCALEACEIVVSSSGEFENLASTRLTFDLAVPANLRPAVSLEPSEDLVDEQVVTLSGAGFKPFTHLSFMQCSLVSTDEHGGGCSYSEQSDSTEIDGTFSVEITVRRLLRSSEVGGVVDCANSGCMIRVRGGNRSPAPLALSFDPEVPLPPGPRMAVRPHNGLVDGQFVKVVARAEGLQWGQFLQCAANEEGVDYQQCRHLRPVFDEAGEGVGDDPPPSPATTEPPAELASADQVADGGVLRVRVQLRREIRSGGHGSQGPPAQVVDCAESAGRCVLVLISESQVRQAVRPLEFDTTVPGLKAKVTIERRNGLVSGEKLKIRVSDSLAETVQARQ
ncbi:MAG: neocarzinostatin apoprotein domain-containing protein, partial [Acidimicrobiales bacterium]